MVIVMNMMQARTNIMDNAEGMWEGEEEKGEETQRGGEGGGSSYPQFTPPNTHGAVHGLTSRLGVSTLPAGGDGSASS